MRAPHERRPTLVFVGGGPRTVGLLERLAASAPELLGDGRIDVHVVDPYPAGSGRIWRREQSHLLWMNSMTSDVTIFTDESVECEGPVVPGPDLATWVRGPGAAILERLGLKLPGPMDFPPRLVQAEYLAWVWQQIAHDLPVTTHVERAVELTPDHRVVLASGKEIQADLVVLALGYLDRLPTLSERSWARQAVDAGLTYIPPGYTADVELSGLLPGEDVIVRGFGQAFIDLMVLLTEARGGWYDDNDGILTYHPSGLEPTLHVGSRRGVPYHAKLGYTVAGARPVPTRYLTPDAMGSDQGVLDFGSEIRPLIDKELAFAHYQQLFTAHPERTRWPWERFVAVLDRTLPDSTEFVAAVQDAIPEAVDRFVRSELDRPLRGRFFADRESFENFLTKLIEDDLLRRASPDYSPDLAVFNALLSVYSVLALAITEGKLSDEDRVRQVETEWHGFFSFVASGPPPRRLEELIALHRAGVVRFAGPEMSVAIEGDQFIASSAGVAGEVRARAFVEARLPRPDVLAAQDPLLRGLLADGTLAADELFAADGTSLGGGQLRADAHCRAIRADGTVHPALFLLGPSVSGSVGSLGFARPHFNAAGLRQNDAVARNLLTLLAPRAAKNARHAS